MRYELTELSCACALGADAGEVAANGLAGSTAGMEPIEGDIPGRAVYFGRVRAELPEIAEREWNFRSNRLLLHALNRKREAFEGLVRRYGADRVAIVLGASNTGVDEAQDYFEEWVRSGKRPEALELALLELGTPAEFLKAQLGVEGPAWVVSTACSSAAKTFAAARRLIEAGMADAAIVGGVDGRCRFALNGFHALGALSEGLCRPLAEDRDGINLGEGVAIFAMERGAGAAGSVEYAGSGETSDAHHATAPDPEGRGAEAAMRAALADAGMEPGEIGYVNLHGTGTHANDEMEMKALRRVWGEKLPKHESTKRLTGHCLGAAGAVEAALCWLYLKAGVAGRAAISNSFAFGGSNASVAFRLN